MEHMFSYHVIENKTPGKVLREKNVGPVFLNNKKNNQYEVIYILIELYTVFVFRENT